MTDAAAASPARAPWLPGILFAAAGAAAGYGIHALLPAVPWLTGSLVLGVVAGCIPALRPALDGRLKPGLGVAARRLLRLGIVVLGLQLSLVDIARLGWVAIVAIVLLVMLSYVITYGIARALRLPGDEPVLLAAGFSICGVSAVGAMSAARGSSSDDTGAPTALVTLYGTLAILVLPLLSLPLGLSNAQFGHWVGASVHDVGQVVATAGAAGATALAVAIVVKLTRVLMLAPMVAVTSLSTRRRLRREATDDPAQPTTPSPAIVPLFIAGFVVLMLVRTVLPVPENVLAIASVVQSALLAAALTGIGANLRLERIARSGIRSLLAGAISWIVILGLALGTVFLPTG